jgi:hypothetical protein
MVCRTKAQLSALTGVATSRTGAFAPNGVQTVKNDRGTP